MTVKRAFRAPRQAPNAWPIQPYFTHYIIVHHQQIYRTISLTSPPLQVLDPLLFTDFRRHFQDFVKVHAHNEQNEYDSKHASVQNVLVTLLLI